MSLMIMDMFRLSHDHGYVPCVLVTIPSFFPRSWIITEYDLSFLTWVRHRLSLIEQSSSPLFVSGVRVVRSLVVCLVFCRPLLSFVFVFPFLCFHLWFTALDIVNFYYTHVGTINVTWQVYAGTINVTWQVYPVA
jgi:hypothetical protein